MFPIAMEYIGKIAAVGTVQVFGYLKDITNELEISDEIGLSVSRDGSLQLQYDTSPYIMSYICII